MHPNLQEMRSAAQSVRATQELSDHAFSGVLGMAADHPEMPSVLAVVSRNRLIGLEIDQSVLDQYRNDLVTLGVYVNTIIRGAFEDWRREVAKQVHV
ncbi:hypothetical protein [Rhodococcus pyridinivorans]|uniref:hypothetical protein n=1 Tax=Rhodococcus pyridinivorans TaxID=103816 RepID=UPI0026590F4C|nr:hypothetical protein [Rhodococcus pyridinivorans]